ncbi:MAG: hypothetical protein WBW04_16395, partial [Nitrolancea sp.]
MKSILRPMTTVGRIFRLLGGVIVLTVLVAACGGSGGSNSTATEAAASTATSTPTSTSAASTPSETAAATPTSMSSPSATATGTTPPTATSTTGGGNPQGTPGGQSDYLDDRSTAEAVIRSYYNAINAKEYARAYSYWEANVDSSQLPPFDQFQQGYSTTESVDLTFGPVGEGVGAGQIYYTVPVQLDATSTDNGKQTFIGCYTVHLGRPEIQTNPPFHPLAIQSAKIDQVASIASVQSMLDSACNGVGDASGTVTPVSNPNDVGAGNYLDNRSDGAEVIRSFYNAINRQEFARAYYYWEGDVPASQLAPFDQFQQGYSDTKSVQLTIGDVKDGAAAGNHYWSVPVTVVSSMTNGSTQTFVGCYQ